MLLIKMRTFFSGLGTYISLVSFTLCNASILTQRESSIASAGQVQREMVRRLSGGTKVYFPFNAEFANYTERWSVASAPEIAVVVVPATAQDIAMTVNPLLSLPGPLALNLLLRSKLQMHSAYHFLL